MAEQSSVQQEVETMPRDAKDKIIQLWTTGLKMTAKTFSNQKWMFDTYVKPKFDTFKKKLESVQFQQTLDLLREKCKNIPLCYEMIERQSVILNLIHGMFLMMCGGSWVYLATFYSFFSVYNVWDTLVVLNTRVKDPEMSSINSCLQILWLKMVALYAVWKIPLLSKITVAFMLEKQVSAAVVNRSTRTFFEELNFGRWQPLVLKGATRLLFAFLSIFLHNIQVCFVMAHLGYHKLCMAISPALRKQIQVFEGPYNLNGTTLTLWACVIACTGWQWFCAYESSLLGIIVPLGFLVHAQKLPEMIIADARKTDD